MNFKNFGSEPRDDGGCGGRPPDNFQLVRQQSIYSLTFDEFQSSLGAGIGKDVGSINMDELLKNIWSAEETQTMGSTSSAGGQESGVPNGYLQRQGSLTLPRTLSQKTVDEVWRDMSKEYGGGGSNLHLPQRQPTLGETTLENFLVRAGVVREEIQLPGNSNNTGFFGNVSIPSRNTSLGFGLQQSSHQNTGLTGNRIPENSNQTSIQSGGLPLNVNGVRSTQQQQQQLFPKQQILSYANPMPIPSSPGIRSGIVGNTDASSMNGSLLQSGVIQGGGMGMIGLGAGAAAVESNGDTSSVSPIPYVFNGGLKGRRSGAVEKVVERRQRRMIKNRESAARSRARKQAYTTELEAEVAKLKEENQELRKKQAEMMEMQKNQVLEMMNKQQGIERRCLRRTQTCP